MPPRKGKYKRPERPIGDPKVKDGFHTWVPRYLEWLAVRAFSPRTVQNRRAYIGFLVDWLEERAVVRPGEVTKPLLDRYQRTRTGIPPSPGWIASGLTGSLRA